MAGLLTMVPNIPVGCIYEDHKEKVRFYMNRMQHSGYSKKQRAAVNHKAKERYNKKVQRHNQKWGTNVQREDLELGRMNEADSVEEKNDWYKRDRS